MSKVGFRTVECIVVWAAAIWLNLYAEQIGQRVAGYAWAVQLVLGFVMFFTSTTWPLALDVAVRRWFIDRDFESRASMLLCAGGITVFGVAVSVSSLAGMNPIPSTPNLTLGMFLGGVASVCAWLCHLRYKAAQEMRD